MANDQIRQWFDFANMQMAAEAFILLGEDNGVLPTDTAQLRTRLATGNLHASVFTPQPFVPM